MVEVEILRRQIQGQIDEFQENLLLLSKTVLSLMIALNRKEVLCEDDITEAGRILNDYGVEKATEKLVKKFTK